jgi:hypothetical protein
VSFRVTLAPGGVDATVSFTVVGRATTGAFFTSFSAILWCASGSSVTVRAAGS